MSETIVIIILVGGLIAAYGLMRWINWYTWGENRAKKEALEKRMEEREEMRKKGTAKKNPDNQSDER